MVSQPAEIIHNSSDRLAIRHRPGYVAAGLCFFLIIVFIVAGFLPDNLRPPTEKIPSNYGKGGAMYQHIDELYAENPEAKKSAYRGLLFLGIVPVLLIAAYLFSFEKIIAFERSDGEILSGKRSFMTSKKRLVRVKTWSLDRALYARATHYPSPQMSSTEVTYNCVLVFEERAINEPINFINYNFDAPKKFISLGYRFEFESDARALARAVNAWLGVSENVVPTDEELYPD